MDNVENDGLEDASEKARIELGLYGNSEEEINREIKETGAVPVLKMAKTPITLLCHTGDVNMNDKGCFRIDHNTCMQQAEWSYGRGKFMPGIEKYLELFNYKPEEILTVKSPTIQHKKIVGLIETAVGVLRVAKSKGYSVPLFFECPETYLHPNKQSCIASFIVCLTEEFK
jgi:hypothetical protein